MKKEQKKMRKTMRHIPGTAASDEVEGWRKRAFHWWDAAPGILQELMTYEGHVADRCVADKSEKKERKKRWNYVH
jgi:hypothetical protein